MSFLRRLEESLKNSSIRSNYLLKHWLNKKETYLHQTGWILSFQEKQPVDVNGNPLPWLSLPCIHFLEPRLQPTFSLFEFGGGNSTIYFAKHVKQIWAVESSESWYERIREQLPDNAEIYHIPLDDSSNYQKAANQPGEAFDIIIVDGRRRNDCVEEAIATLSSSGVIIIDDTDRERYTPSAEFLKKQGFKSIEFWGMAPGSTRKKCTTVYYKQANCLDI